MVRVSSDPLFKRVNRYFLINPVDAALNITLEGINLRVNPEYLLLALQHLFHIVHSELLIMFDVPYQRPANTHLPFGFIRCVLKVSELQVEFMAKLNDSKLRRFERNDLIVPSEHLHSVLHFPFDLCYSVAVSFEDSHLGLSFLLKLLNSRNSLYLQLYFTNISFG
jgi:hypothetical protein